MFQFLKREKQAPVLVEDLSVFGKLPGIADYTKVNAHFEHAIAFNAEVERLVNALHEQGSDTIHSLDMQCVFEEEGRFKVVQLCHSHDKSGRAYPFTAVGYVQHPLIKACQPTMPLILSPWVNYLTGLQRQTHITSKAALEQDLKKSDLIRFTQTKASLLEDEITQLKSCFQSHWLSEVFPDKPLEHIAAQILSVGKEIVSLKGGDAITFSLSPLHVLPSTLFWLQWIESLLQPKRWPLHYCVVSTKSYAHLHVWLRAPEKVDFCAWATQIEMHMHTTCADDRLRQLLSRHDVTLCDTLYLLQQEVLRAIA